MRKSWIKVIDKSELENGERVMYADMANTIGLNIYRYVSKDGLSVVNSVGDEIYRSVSEMFECWEDVFVLRNNEEDRKSIADKIAEDLLKNVVAVKDDKMLTKDELSALIQKSMSNRKAFNENSREDSQCPVYRSM